MPAPDTAWSAIPGRSGTGLSRRRLLAGAGGGVIALAAASPQAQAAPAADPWPRWKAHGDDPQAAPDHSPWTAFLKDYLKPGQDGINRVAYGAVTASARQDLDAYLARLGKADIAAMPRDAQFAFWVNLYNALTVQVILDHYPVDSIRDINISPGWFSTGPWGKTLIAVDGVDLSLDDIEHRILRPLWQDPRIHYAVNCAALGCPNLRGEAMTAANKESFLQAGARDYVNHPRGATVRDDGKLVVSSIYDWFQEDFGGTEAGVLAHLRRHATPDLAESLAQGREIARYRYDWTLNDAREGAAETAS